MRSKSRLTITLPRELLTRVDQLVDGKNIRNRSHGIETLIRSSLKPTVTTAVIIAGGKTNKQVSALKKIDGRYLLNITLDNLKKHNITNVIICAGPNQEKIEAELGGGAKFGVAIRYVKEKTPLGTAGALKAAAAHLQGNPFLVIHGDVLSDINLQDLIQFHLSEDTLATIGVKPRMGELNYGQAFLHGNKIIRFLERGTPAGISIVNTGIYVLKPELLERIPKNKVVSMEADIFPALAEQNELSAFVYQGIWYDVSKSEAYKEADAKWRRLG